MAHPQTSDTLQGKASGPTGVTNANPSFKRASVLFVPRSAPSLEQAFCWLVSDKNVAPFA
jgi:hypothetical protein